MASALTSSVAIVGGPIAAEATSERWVIPAILGQILCTTAIIPIANVAGPELPALTPFFLSGMLTTELAISFLLFAWFFDIRTRPALLVASAYLFSTLLLIDYLLTFPSAVLPDRAVIGGAQAAPWIFIIWAVGFAGLTQVAAALQWRGGNLALSFAQAKAASFKAVCGVCAVGGMALALAASSDFLPPMVAGAVFTPLHKLCASFGLIVLLLGIAIILLHLRKANELFAWLAVALTGRFCGDLLTALGGARFTVGWSSARLFWVISASVMFLFFIRQFVRRQHLLIGRRQALEDAVAQRTVDLTETIRQRDVLLREVYHRVNNNLQVVDALITMERERIKDLAARDALSELRSRVFALGLVHQHLMSSDDLATFPIAPFLRQLCDSVADTLKMTERGIRLEVDAEAMRVNLDFAIPVGLLATELLSIAAKRAKTTSVRLSFQSGASGEALLSVEDNGSSDQVSATDGDLTGVRVIKGLTRQLDGTMQIARGDGTCVQICLPLPAIAA